MCDQVSFPLGEYVVGLEKYCIFFNMFVTTGIISLYLTKYNNVAFSGLNPQSYPTGPQVAEKGIHSQ
jgi:hypothetical protein